MCEILCLLAKLVLGDVSTELIKTGLKVGKGTNYKLYKLKHQLDIVRACHFSHQDQQKVETCSQFSIFQ